ncbi:MAG: hypothetical protein RR388_09195, partial [Rikenellaceae bacterium]
MQNSNYRTLKIKDMFFMLQAADTTAKMGFKKLIENMASMTGNEIIQFAVHGIITVTIKILL